MGKFARQIRRDGIFMIRRVVAIRLEGGHGHEHIVRLWWTSPGTSATGDGTRAEMVAWLEAGYNTAYVEDEYDRRADVKVRTSTYGHKYVQTKADGYWTNNLLALPRK